MFISKYKTVLHARKLFFKAVTVVFSVFVDLTENLLEVLSVKNRKSKTLIYNEILFYVLLRNFKVFFKIHAVVV